VKQKKIDISMGRKLESVGAEDSHHRRTPAPNAYKTMEGFNNISHNGGTGNHTGNEISFTKDNRKINYEIEKRGFMPGPG
jgi:hypothetical protein